MYLVVYFSDQGKAESQLSLADPTSLYIYLLAEQKHYHRQLSQSSLYLLLVFVHITELFCAISVKSALVGKEMFWNIFFYESWHYNRNKQKRRIFFCWFVFAYFSLHWVLFWGRVRLQKAICDWAFAGEGVAGVHKLSPKRSSVCLYLPVFILAVPLSYTRTSHWQGDWNDFFWLNSVFTSVITLYVGERKIWRKNKSMLCCRGVLFERLLWGCYGNDDRRLMWQCMCSFNSRRMADGEKLHVGSRQAVCPRCFSENIFWLSALAVIHHVFMSELELQVAVNVLFPVSTVCMKSAVQREKQMRPLCINSKTKATCPLREELEEIN